MEAPVYSYIKIVSSRVKNPWMKFVRIDSNGECLQVLAKECLDMNSEKSVNLTISRGPDMPNLQYMSVYSCTEPEFKNVYEKATKQLKF
jgi:hypothetical protein